MARGTLENYDRFKSGVYSSYTQEEKNIIKLEHLARAIKGEESWNSWANKFEKHIGKFTSSYIIDLSGLEIIDSLTFSAFKFPCGVTFSNTIFSGDANFYQAQFHGSAKFSEAHFRCDADFNQAQFRGYVHFHQARFSKLAKFNQTHFSDYARFNQAHFNALAGFNEARFGNVADFTNAQFIGDVHFKKTKFKGDGYFTKAQFHGDARFSEAHFSVYVRFNKTQFDTFARFSEVHFGGHASFSEAQFSGNTDFSYTNWEGKSIFLATQFEAVCNFKNSKFEIVPNYNFASFVQPPHISNMSVKPLYDKTELGLVERYRKIKEMAIQSKDFENELKYFGLETNAKAFLPETSWSQKNFILAYKEISNFGKSLSRPVISLFLFLFAMSVINGGYILLANNISKECSEDKLEYVSTVVQYTLSEASPLFKLTPKRAIEIETCLFEHKASDLRNSLWRILHLLPTTLFLFLFGLAVRNKFKIR